MAQHLLRPPIILPQVIRPAEVGEGVGLPEPVTEVSEQLVGLVEDLLRPPKVPPRVIHAAEVGEGGGLPGSVVGVLGSGQRGVVDVASLVPSAAGRQVVEPQPFAEMDHIQFGRPRRVPEQPVSQRICGYALVSVNNSCRPSPKSTYRWVKVPAEPRA